MPVESDEQKIVRLFEDGDRALVAADLPGLSRIFADDYVQYDETGRASTKQDVLNKLKSGAIRYVSMISTGRHIRLFSRETAVVHGSEEDEVEQAGKRRSIRYIYMDAVVKRNGEWQIVASQLARPAETR
ncbi:MAG: nuclear transport factor 2 family protein [Candidatus Sulfotelmatobacter sp.]